MKKSAIIISILSAIVFVSPFAFSEEHDMDQQDGMEQKGMMGKGMKGMQGMHQKPTIVATSDGGIVVLNGPKLVKYDSQLVMVNEVELPKGPAPKNEGGAKKEVQTLTDAEVKEMLAQDEAPEPPAGQKVGVGG